jgi:hypothetical protein
MRNVRAKAIRAWLDLVGADIPILEVAWELQDGTCQIRKSGHFLNDGDGRSSKTPLEWAQENMERAGYTGRDLTELDGCDCSKMLPSEVILVLIPDPKNDKFENVKYINRLGGATLEKKNGITGQALAELKMRCRAAAAATATSAPKEEPEIPFDDDEFANM